MPKLLSADAVEQFKRDGFYFPVPVLSRDEAAGYRRSLEQHEARTGKPLQGNWRHKTHLLFTWADELVHHPRILDAIEDVIGAGSPAAAQRAIAARELVEREFDWGAIAQRLKPRLLAAAASPRA